MQPTAKHDLYVEALRENLTREAEQLVLDYAMMAVTNTPFDVSYSSSSNSLQTPEVDTELSLTETAPSMKLQRTASTNATPKEGVLSPDNKSQKKATALKLENLVKRAAPMKCAAMWSALTTAALFQSNLTEHFRLKRLRHKLTHYLLPHLMARRLKAAVGAQPAPASETGPATGGDGSVTDAQAQPVSDRPTGAMLMKCCSWIQALQDTAFAEEVARSMQKMPKLIGDDLAKVGDNSQAVLYLATTGRIELTTPPMNGASGTSERVQAPLTFGDVFGGLSRYKRSIVARSKVTLWYVNRSAFSQLLEGWHSSRTRDLFQLERKKELLASIPDVYPLAPHRLPLMRRMPAALVSGYFGSFEPVLLEEGTVLCEEGSTAGVVYVFCEGVVCRSKKSYGEEGAVSQLLSMHSTTVSEPEKRYAFLGEEPHILPEKHRYQCSVHSEFFKGYRVPAGVFTSMLLDDPKLLLQMRDDTLAQRAKSMRIKADALRAVPMLQEFPAARLHALMQAMTPKVVERSTLICQSQQTMRDIFLIIRGDVRDPRRPGLAPPILPPPPKIALPPTTPGGLVPSNNASLLQKENTFRTESKDRDDLVGSMAFGSYPRFGSMMQRSSFILPRLGSMQPTSLMSTMSSGPGEATIVQEEESNPAPPTQISSAILHALGGSWEGLLQEKWTCTWEATSVVEMWVLPTAAIRTEYNALSRGLQTNILHQLRVNQMKDLELPEMPSTKLPPMSMYRTSGPSTGQSVVEAHFTASMIIEMRQAENRARQKVKPGKGAGASGSEEASTGMEGLVRDEMETSTQHPPSSNSPSRAVGLANQKKKSPTHNKASPPRNSSQGRKAAKSKQKTTSTAIVAASNPDAPAGDEGSAEELAAMRKQAQVRNERARLLRQMPLDELIRMETDRLRRGVHRFNNTQLPNLTATEDRLYFGIDDTETSIIGQRRLPGGVSPPRSPNAEAMATAPSSNIPFDKMERFYLGNQRMDEVNGSADEDRVVRGLPLIPAPPAPASARLPQRHRKHHASEPSSVSHASLPLPQGLSLMMDNVESSKRSASAPKAKRSEHRNDDRRAGNTSPSQNCHPPPRRWFKQVPSVAPAPRFSNMTVMDGEAFDILLLQTLKSAKASGLLQNKGTSRGL